MTPDKDTEYDPRVDKPVYALTDAELYEAYQHAKSHGPRRRFNALQSVMCERWMAAYDDTEESDG